jgi:ribosomal protein S18 acetylase RimI-like enzyme
VELGGVPSSKEFPFLVHIERIQVAHLDELTEVHMRAFPGFFLTSLGKTFVRLFYQSFTEDWQGIGFVVVADGGKVVGGVVGPLVPDGYFKRLLYRRWFAFCLASLGALVRTPNIAPRLMRAVWYRGGQLSVDGRRRALLSSIAVAPDAQGFGLGGMLVGAWLDEVCRRGGKGAFLTTDAEGNDAVNQFYRRLGWRLEAVYCTREGRSMNRYVVDFDRES